MENPTRNANSDNLLCCGDIESNPGPGVSTDNNDLATLKELWNNCEEKDVIEIKYHLNRFGLTDAHEDDLEQMKVQLKIAVLEEILKTEVQQRDYFEKCLAALKQKLKRKQSGYDCCFSGCTFRTKKHRSLVAHMKSTHPRATLIKCNFKKLCIRVFDKIEDLINHVKSEHSSLDNPTTARKGMTGNQIDIPCKCILHSCGSQNFRNVKELMTHINTFHQHDTRHCIFEDCTQAFPPSYKSRNHFRRKHINSEKMSLKPAHILDADNIGPESLPFLNEILDTTEGCDIEGDEYGDYYDAFDIDYLEGGNDELDDESEKYFLDYYADFLNRLVHEKFIPQTTVQDISEEYLENTKKAQEVRDKQLRNLLQEMESTTREEIDRISKNLIDDDFFLKAQKQLNTKYKRTKYVKDNMQYVAPIEILLNDAEVKSGAKKDVIHYIPLKEAVKNLMEDKTVIEMFRSKKPVSKEGVIADIIDGSIYKSNPFFEANEDALGLILYSDGVELKVM